MRDSARRFALLICAWMVAASFAPCVALADAMPEPPPGPTPQVVETVTPATEAVTPVRPAAPTPGHGGSSGANFPLAALEAAGLFLGPLLLTLLIEVPVIAVAGRGSAAAWKTGVLVNTLTNPIAVLCFLLLAPVAWGSTLRLAPYLLTAAIELAVVIAEWRVFRWALGWSNRRAIVTALVANALSFGVGLAVTSVWWFGF
jgi:hypothetical protein